MTPFPSFDVLGMIQFNPSSQRRIIIAALAGAVEQVQSRSRVTSAALEAVEQAIGIRSGSPVGREDGLAAVGGCIGSAA
jgi:H+/Cl- antiporter ClcA